MTIVGSKRFGFSLLLVATAMTLAWPKSGAAYTQEEQQACSGDAMRLCSAFVPDVDRITVCMVQHKSQLSPPCRAFFGPDPVSRKGKVHRVKRPERAQN